MARTDSTPATPDDESGPAAQPTVVPVAGPGAAPELTEPEALVVTTVPVTEVGEVDAVGELDDLDDDLEDDDLEYLDGLPLDDARPLLPSLAARLGAELVGTFAVVLVLLGTGLYSPLLQSPGAVGIALAGGLVLTGVTAAFGLLSGGHFNPAVTLASAIAGRTSWLDLVVYWLAQIAGAVAAAAVVFATIPGKLPGAMSKSGASAVFADVANGYGTHSPLSTLSQGAVTFDLRAAFIVELLSAGVLAAVYLGAGPRAGVRRSAPVAIGLTYAGLILFTAPFTGSSINPARSTGAALFAGSAALGQLWLFWVAPLIGAAIAGLIHRAATSAPAAPSLGYDERLTEEPVLRGY